MAAESAHSDVSFGIVTARTQQLLRPSALHFVKNGRQHPYEQHYHPYGIISSQQKSTTNAVPTPARVIIKQELEETDSPPEWQHYSPRSDDDNYEAASSSNLKICTVCGDVARGHHYDVISCNGCKTFFRRTVIAGRKFRCLKDGNCDLSKDRRCACRACRFKKCVDVGMNPKAIQYQSVTATTTSVIVKKRSLSSDEDTPSPQRLDAIVSPGDDYRTSQTIDFLLLMEQMSDRLRRSSFMPESDDLVTVDLLNMPTIFADVNRYSEVKSWPERPPTLREVQLIPLVERRKIGLKIWYYIESLLAIEYAKMLPGIEELAFDDKLALCRSTCYTTIILTQGFCAFQQKSDMICFPDGFRPLKRIKNPTTLQLEINCKIPEILRRIEIDKAQHALLKSIIFLNTAAPGLSDEGRALIERLRSERANDLLNYLRSSMGSARGAAQFATLISLCDTCTRLCAKQQANFVKAVFVDRRIKPPPLMIELIAQIGHTKPVGTPDADRSPVATQWV